MNRRRGPVITQQWLADFYANGVQGKYKASIKKAAQENNKNKKDKKEKKDVQIHRRRKRHSRFSKSMG